MGKENVVTDDVLWSCVTESNVILSTSVTSTNSIKRKKINEEINLVCGNKNLSNIEKIKFSYTNSENYGLWVIMICHVGASVVRNMHTMLVRDVDDEGGLFMCGDRRVWEALYLPFNFAGNLKLLQKFFLKILFLL